MTAAVHLDARRVVNAGLPADNLIADLSLTDGVLKLKPLIFGADAGRIAMNLTINAVKYIVGEVMKDESKRNLARCAEVVEKCFASNDFIEGRRAFMEKRKPVFTGT